MEHFASNCRVSLGSSALHERGLIGVEMCGWFDEGWWLGNGIVRVALIAHVFEDRVHVVETRLTPVIHANLEVFKTRSRLKPHDGLSSHPREIVPRCDVKVKRIVPSQVCRSRNVQLVRMPRSGKIEREARGSAARSGGRWRAWC